MINVARLTAAGFFQLPSESRGRWLQATKQQARGTHIVNVYKEGVITPSSAPHRVLEKLLSRHFCNINQTLIFILIDWFKNEDPSVPDDKQAANYLVKILNLMNSSRTLTQLRMLCNGNGAISHLRTEMGFVEDYCYSLYN